MYSLLKMATNNQRSPVDMDEQLDPDIMLRKRQIWTNDDSFDLTDGEYSDEEEDIPGCPLPSTPEDNQLLEAEVKLIDYANNTTSISCHN